jgi:hypothetical protein
LRTAGAYVTRSTAAAARAALDVVTTDQVTRERA